MLRSARAFAPRIWRRLFLAIFTLWSVANARAADNAWSPIGPDGGYIERVAFHKTSQNTMYLMATGGFFSLDRRRSSLAAAAARDHSPGQRFCARSGR